jgi:uncharacterized membrane protein YedE/YeeE
MSNQKTARTPGALWNPYVAGVGLGLVLLTAFVVIGQGLGASGGVGRIMASGIAVVNHDFMANSSYFGKYFQGAGPLYNYLVFLALGVFLGGFIAAYTGGRAKIQIEKGPNTTNKKRLVMALGGGVIMGFAARLAYGCTSGQALTGGATLAAGSWVFMFAVFGGGYAIAWFVRRQWL